MVSFSLQAVWIYLSQRRGGGGGGGGGGGTETPTQHFTSRSSSFVKLNGKKHFERKTELFNVWVFWRKVS